MKEIENLLGSVDAYHRQFGLKILCAVINNQKEIDNEKMFGSIFSREQTGMLERIK